MNHEAFRDMVKYFVGIWRDGKQETTDVSRLSNGHQGDQVKVWGWWRTHPAMLNTQGDEVGQPSHAEWVQLQVAVRRRKLTIAVSRSSQLCGGRSLIV